MKTLRNTSISRMIIFTLLVITTILANADVTQAASSSGWIAFQNARSRLYVNGEDLNLEVCASNLTGKTVYVLTSRPGKVWPSQKYATSNCITFVNLEGAGPLLANTTYTTRVGLGAAPDSNWPVPCWSATGGKGLCDKLTSGPAPTPIGGREKFINASSRLYVSGEDLNLEVCASNLTGKRVFAQASRSGKTWNPVSLVASGRCVTFKNLEEAGPLLASTTYTTRASLGAAPDPNWPVPCWSATGGYGLCDKLTSNPAPVPQPQPDPSAYTGIKLPFKSGESYTVTGDRNTHSGTDRHAVDIGMTNDPILAIHSGTIMYSGWDKVGGGGNMVIINHNDGYCSLYAHLSLINVRFGQSVSQGSLIGISGSTGYSTGPHLHLSVSHMRGSRCTGEIPMHFDEVGARELRKGDVVASKNAVVGGIGDAFAAEAMQELQPGEITVGYDDTKVYPGTNVVLDIIYYPPQEGAKALELACEIDPTLLTSVSMVDKGLFGSEAVNVITKPDVDGKFNLALASTGENIVNNAGSVFQLTFETLKSGTASFDCGVTQIDANGEVGTLPFEAVAFEISEETTTAPTDPIDDKPIDPDPPIIVDPVDPGDPKTGVKVSGKVILPVAKYGDVAITVYDAAGEIAAETGLDTAGKFDLYLEAGSYEFEAKAAGYLSARGTFEVTADEPFNLTNVTLLAGDLNGDSQIDILDVTTLGAAYKKSPITNDAADLNGDNQVDILDLVALANNFGIAGIKDWK